MKIKLIIIILTLILLLGDCLGKEWYRELPERNYSQNFNFDGVWLKSTNPRSAINSSWHKNSWSQKLVVSKGKFTLEYKSIDLIGKILQEKEIISRGIAQSKGNWLLLKTESNDIKSSKDGKIVDIFKNSTDKSLLYYFNKEYELLFPMMYDTLISEMKFGVMDGVVEPYNEEERNFRTYMKTFAFKEYQPHSYKKVN